MKGLLDGWLPESEMEMAERVDTDSTGQAEPEYDMEYERALSTFAKAFVTEWRSYEGPAKYTAPIEKGW